MNASYRRLFNMLALTSAPPPTGMVAALRELPAVGELPRPWTSWVLFGMVRYHRLHHWAWRVMIDLLLGAGILDRTVAGYLPDQPEWRYIVDDRSCNLTNRATGEEVCMRLWLHTEPVPLLDYSQMLKRLRHREPIEERVVQLHPSIEAVGLAVRELREAGLLEEVLVDRDFDLYGLADQRFDVRGQRLAAGVLEHADAIDGFCDALRDPAGRIWALALVGDWPDAHEAAIVAGDPELVVLTGERADECRDRRRRLIRERIAREGLDSTLLRALTDLRSNDQTHYLRLALRQAGRRDEINAATIEHPAAQVPRRDRAHVAAEVALEIIEEQASTDWSPEVFELLDRVAPGGPAEYLDLACDCARFLARHGDHAGRVIARITRDDRLLDEAVLLSLEHDPRQAGPLIARALGSQVAGIRMQVAAVLALIDRPWSIRLLARTLQRWHDPIATAECREALRASRDPQAASLLRSWEDLFLGEDGPGPESPSDPWPGRDEDLSLEEMMDYLHERVMPLRSNVHGEDLFPDDDEAQELRGDAGP